MFALWLAAGAFPYLVLLVARAAMSAEPIYLVWFSAVAGRGWTLSGLHLLIRCARGRRTSAANVAATVLLWWAIVLPFGLVIAVLLLILAIAFFPVVLAWVAFALAFLVGARRELLRSRRWRRGPAALALAVGWLLLPALVAGFTIHDHDLRWSAWCIVLDGVGVLGLGLLGFAYDLHRSPTPGQRLTPRS